MLKIYMCKTYNKLQTLKKNKQLHNKIVEIILQLFITCNTHTHTKHLMQLTLMKLNIQGHYPKDIFCNHQTLTPNQIQKSNSLNWVITTRMYIHDNFMFQALVS